MTRVLRWPETVFATATVLLAMYCVLLDSDVTSPGLDGLGVAMLTILFGLLMILARIALALLHPRGEKRRALIARPIAPLCALGTIILSVVLMALEIPSHVRFAWSRDDLETAVEDTHEAWWTGEEGRWIGLYKVHGISFDKEGETYIDLGGCGMLDHCWFMYEPQPDSQRHRLATSRMSEHWWLLRDPF